jgi:hypothetical protein
MRIAINEMMVKIRKAKERLKFLDRRRLGPGKNGIKVFEIHFDAVSTNDVTQVLNFRLVPFTFCRISAKVMVLKVVEH